MNGTDVLIAAVCLALLLFAWAYASWSSWNEERRSRRLVERNLWRISGGRGL